MEIADVFVVNKSDHLGADQLGPGHPVGSRLRGFALAAPIVRTFATERRGIDELHQDPSERGVLGDPAVAGTGARRSGPLKNAGGSASRASWERRGSGSSRQGGWRKCFRHRVAVPGGAGSDERMRRWDAGELETETDPAQSEAGRTAPASSAEAALARMARHAPAASNALRNSVQRSTRPMT